MRRQRVLWHLIGRLTGVFLGCSLLIAIAGSIKRSPRSVYGAVEFHTFCGAFPIYSSLNGTSGKNLNIRIYKWKDAGNNEREAVFHIPKLLLKKEIRRFGTSPVGVSSPFFLHKKGFKVIGKRNIMKGRRVTEHLISVVDYKQIYERSLEYFPPQTQKLSRAVQLTGDTDPLGPFLSFIQNIRYEMPPNRYKGKFINSFFVPLVCLDEQYGDCDSKSLLLAVFLGTQPGFKQKTAMVLIRGPGIAHAVLAVNRKPLPRMFRLFDMKTGFYVPVETTKPGWYAGFLSRHLIETMKRGYFHVVPLN